MGVLPEEDMLIGTEIKLYQQVQEQWSEEDGKAPTSTWKNLNQWLWGVDSTIIIISSTWELLEIQIPGLGIWFSW